MYANCVIYRDPDDPGHTVRLMPGIPESPVRQARAPYVVHASVSYTHLDVYKRQVLGGGCWDDSP